MATSAAAVKEEPATTFAKDQLKAIVERIERLEEEKKTISDDIRDVCWECCEAEQAMLSYAGLTRVSINLHKGSYEGDGLPGRRRTKATPSFGRLCPAMTMSLSAAMRSASRMTASPASQSPVR